MRRSSGALLGLLLFTVAGCGATAPKPARPAPPIPHGAPTEGETSPIAQPGPSLPGIDATTARGLADLIVPKIEGPALEVHFIDIGQGDSVFIRTPDEKHILVDTGPSKGRPHLVRYLRALGVEHIDLLVNSHGHADHIAGFPKVVQHFDVKMVLDPGLPHATPTYKQMVEAVEKRKIPFKVARRGRRIQVGAELGVEILAPEDPLLSGTRSDLNANSVVMRLTFGQVRFLLMGDAEDETEGRLLRGDPEQLVTTVLKVAHHGSRFATHAAFLRAASPRLAVISCGRSNRYGHPDPLTLRRLRSAGVATFVTAELGDIVITTDGEHIAVQADAPKKGAVRVGTPVPPAKQLDINLGTAEAFTALPWIGEKTALRIVAYRLKHGPFQSVDDLIKVKGIGERRLARFRHLVRVGPPPSPATP